MPPQFVLFDEKFGSATAQQSLCGIALIMLERAASVSINRKKQHDRKIILALYCIHYRCFRSERESLFTAIADTAPCKKAVLILRKFLRPERHLRKWYGKKNHLLQNAL